MKETDDMVCLHCQGTGLEKGSDANDGTTWHVIPCWDCDGTGYEKLPTKENDDEV